MDAANLKITIFDDLLSLDQRSPVTSSETSLDSRALRPQRIDTGPSSLILSRTCNQNKRWRPLP